jgi:hypothetical protein
MIEWLKPLAGAAEPGGQGWSWGLRGFSEDAEDLSPLLFWTYLGVSIGLVTMAGMASGLTLGLMSLDELDLEVGSGLQADQKESVPCWLACVLCRLYSMH